MNDKSLAAFSAAARSGSFSVAAWELSTTQQNVSYIVHRLEEELGFPLFVRRVSRVELTAAGESFLAWYTAFDHAAADVASRFDHSVPAGSVTDSQVRCFLMAARLGSLTTAAEALFYSPPALERNIAALEGALGTVLFRKEKGRLALTAQGEAYKTLFADAAQALEETCSQARTRFEAGKFAAAVGLSEWLDEERLLGGILEGFPGRVTVRVMDNQALLEALESGAVDMALWSEGHAPVNRGLEMTAIAEEDLCVFVPEDGGPCPMVVCPGWPRSYIENRAISTQEAAFPGFVPSGTMMVRTVGDIRKKLLTGRYAAVGDRRFGFLSDFPCLRAIPLDTGTHIMACRRSNAVDDCAARLIDWLAQILVGGTK